MSVCRVPGPVDPGSPGVPGIPGITRAGYPGRFFSNLGNPGFRRFGSTSFAGFPNPAEHDELDDEAQSRAEYEKQLFGKRHGPFGFIL